MTISFETIFNILTMVLVPVVGWLVNSLHKSEKDLAEFKLEVSREYINQKVVDRLEQKIDNLQQMINELYRLVAEKKTND